MKFTEAALVFVLFIAVGLGAHWLCRYGPVFFSSHRHTLIRWGVALFLVRRKHLGGDIGRPK